MPNPPPEPLTPEGILKRDEELRESMFSAPVTARDDWAKARHHHRSESFPALLAEIDRLRVEVNALQEANDAAAERMKEFLECADSPLMRTVMDERDRLRAKVERLTERLENAGDKKAYLGRHETLVVERDAARADADRLAEAGDALLNVFHWTQDNDPDKARPVPSLVAWQEALRQHEEAKP